MVQSMPHKAGMIPGVFSTPGINGTIKSLERVTGGAFQFYFSRLMHFVDVRRKLCRFILGRIRGVAGQTRRAFADIRMFLWHDSAVILMTGVAGVVLQWRSASPNGNAPYGA